MSEQQVSEFCDINKLRVSDEESIFITTELYRTLKISRTIIDNENIKLTINEEDNIHFTRYVADLNKYEAIVPRIIRIGSELMYHYYYTMEILKKSCYTSFVRTEKTIKLTCKYSYNDFDDLVDVNILIVFKRVN